MNKKYDPRTFGAKCDVCPLGPNGALRKDSWEPVGPEIHRGCTVLAVAESPGAEEVGRGRPLVGQAGSEWGHALATNNLTRPHIDLDNVIACKPPGEVAGAWKRLNKSVDLLNKQRVRSGQEIVPHPVACCTPRLQHTAKNYPNIITLGKTATSVLTGLTGSILNSRGGPLRVTTDWRVTQDEAATSHRVLPTVHPSFTMRAPSWRPVLHADIGKAFRWFKDALNWTTPENLWRPTPDQLEEWLQQPAPFWAYDVETDGIEPLTCALRTIAISIPDLKADGRVARTLKETAQVCRGVGVSLLSSDGRTRFYSDTEERRIKEILAAAFTDGRTWVGHNAGAYDRQVIEHHLGVTPAPLIDTLFPARFRAPDLPKGLKTIGSILLDVERWETTEKGDSIATGSTNDDELLSYNLVDTAVSARIVAPLIDAASEAGAFRPLPEALKPASWPENKPWNLFEVDHQTQDMCVEMHKIGIYIDQAQRGDLEAEYEISVKRREANLKELSTTVGLRGLDLDNASDEINPGSAAQIRDLLYNIWGLSMPPAMDAREFYTESGQPSTGDSVIRAHMASGLLGAEQMAFLKELRLYRREKNKILGAMLRPMQLRSLEPKKGLVWDDGRTRSTWSAHTTSVGRLSCSKQNLQTIGSNKGQGRIKTIFAAEPGHYLLGADLDQAHLRITASYWKIPLLLECFEEGKDPHSTLAYSAFGDKYKNADGWGPDGFSLYRKPQGGTANAMRQMSKTLRYASIYGANPTTVWRVISSTETDGGNLPYVNITLREIRMMHDAWMKSEPEWMDAWDRMMAMYEHQRYMEDPVMYRRSGPLEDGKLNAVVNYPILAAEGNIMRLCEANVRDAFPYEFQGRSTGMLRQCHDSIEIELALPSGVDPNWKPKKGEPLHPEMEKARLLLEECMNLTIPGWEVPITSEASAGRTFKDV